MFLFHRCKKVSNLIVNTKDIHYDGTCKHFQLKYKMHIRVFKCNKSYNIFHLHYSVVHEMFPIAGVHTKVSEEAKLIYWLVAFTCSE